MGESRGRVTAGQWRGSIAANGREALETIEGDSLAEQWLGETPSEANREQLLTEVGAGGLILVEA